MIPRTGPQALLFTDPVRYFGQNCQGYREGYVKGMADAILIVLESRGLPVSPELRERVFGSTDIETLERWLRRAITVARAEQVFA